MRDIILICAALLCICVVIWDQFPHSFIYVEDGRGNVVSKFRVWGDGVHDDTERLQRAFDSVTAIPFRLRWSRGANCITTKGIEFPNLDLSPDAQKDQRQP